MKNKNRFKKAVSLFLSISCAGMALAGCGDNQTNSGKTSQTQAPSTQGQSQKPTEGSSGKDSASEKDSSSEPTEAAGAGSTADIVDRLSKLPKVDLTYWCSLPANAAASITNFSELEINQEMERMANVNVTFSHPASGQQTEQFNLKMTTDTFEDMVEYHWGYYPGGPDSAIQEGVILDLKPYIDRGLAPNFKKILDENPDVAKQIYTDSGRIYAFPPIALNCISATTGFMFRSDWLKELNMDAPETIQEWEQVLTAFKEKKGATAPFTVSKNILIKGLSGAFGVDTACYVKDGKVLYGPLQQGYKDFISTMADWYKKGLLDPDYIGNDGKIVDSNMVNGKSGATTNGMGTLGTYITAARKDNPNYSLVPVQYPVLKKGDAPMLTNAAMKVRNSGLVAVSAKCKDPERAIAFLDLHYSEEGTLLKNFGIEGKTYTMVNNEPVYTDLILKNPDGLSIAQALGKYTRASTPSIGLIHPSYHKQYYQLPEQQEGIVVWNQYADQSMQYMLPPVTPTEAEAEELASINNALNTFVQEETTQFIMGIKDMKEYDAFLEALKGMQAERMVEIYQQAYERYMKR